MNFQEVHNPFCLFSLAEEVFAQTPQFDTEQLTL